MFHPHVEGHVVGRAVPVVVGEVMDCADGHHDLAESVDDGQVDDGPAGGEVKGHRTLLFKVWPVLETPIRLKLRGGDGVNGCSTKVTFSSRELRGQQKTKWRRV